MKFSALLKIQTLSLLLFVTVLSSCIFGQGENLTDLIEGGMSEDNFAVATNTPKSNDAKTTFSGEILKNNDSSEVTYGFMWYSPTNEAYLEPTKVVVGKSVELVRFSVEAKGLPVNTDLVVCAFIESKENEENPMIGDEIDFIVER